MASCYRSTRNPTPIQQCDKLVAQAVACGLRTAVTPMGIPVSQIGSTTVLVVSAELSQVRPSAAEPAQQAPAGRDASQR